MLLRGLKILATIICLTFVTSCGGDSDYLTLEEYITQNQLITETTNSGLQYIIKTPGGAEKPNIGSTINIKYRGYFLGGDDFDGNNNATFPLNRLIAGWQEGIPLIGEGGSITLIIPSELAYGSRGQGNIPPNTDLGFDIDLIGFQ